MPKSFLLKRSFVSSTAKSHNQGKEATEKKNRSFKGEDEETKCTNSTEQVPLPTLSPLIDRGTSDVFTYTRAVPLNEELIEHTAGEEQFSIYRPFYHLAIPGTANSMHDNFHAYLTNVKEDFGYMHVTGFRNEHRLNWSPNLSAPHQTVFNSDIFKGEMAFTTPPKVLIPNEIRQPYRCDQCGKIFKTKYTLAIHLKMPNHTFARPFVCNTCGKGFRLSSTLCRHKIIHTKEKPYKCHVCNKAFNRSSTLKTHLRTHSLEKEFVCDRCGKGFHQKGNLRNHILIHTGEKPYKCTLCQKAFNKLSNLKFHMHVHADNSPYRCGVCKVSFSRRCDLKSHLQNAHSQTESDLSALMHVK